MRNAKIFAIHTLVYTKIIVPKFKNVTFCLDAGGKQKATAIKEYARRANPDLDFETIDNALTNKLSKLYRNKELSAVQSEIRKDGYDYFVTEEQKKAAGL